VENAKITNKDIILEIGTGKGNLTKKLSAAKPAKVISVELDTKIKPGKFPKNVEFIYGNGLDSAKDLDYNKIVSNIPYHISEPLFNTIIKKKPELCIFVTGKKFYDSLEQSTGRIPDGINSLYSLKKIMDVSKDDFIPSPRVDSVLFCLESKKQTQEEKIISFIIEQDDKTVKNAAVETLKKVLNKTGSDARKTVAEKIPKKLASKRVRHLSNVQWKTVKEIVLKIK